MADHKQSRIVENANSENFREQAAQRPTPNIERELRSFPIVSDYLPQTHKVLHLAEKRLFIAV
jgi:hypothetical protein